MLWVLPWKLKMLNSLFLCQLAVFIIILTRSKLHYQYNLEEKILVLCKDNYSSCVILFYIVQKQDATILSRQKNQNIMFCNVQFNWRMLKWFSFGGFLHSVSENYEPPLQTEVNYKIWLNQDWISINITVIKVNELKSLIILRRLKGKSIYKPLSKCKKLDLYSLYIYFNFFNKMQSLFAYYHRKPNIFESKTSKTKYLKLFCFI